METVSGSKVLTGWTKSWQDAFTQEYNISVSGGNDKSHYAFSGNYTDQTGIIRNSGYDRLAVRANVGSQVNRG